METPLVFHAANYLMKSRAHRYRECKYRARYDLWPVCLTTARESGCISCKCLRVHWKPPLTRKGSSFNVGKSHGPTWFVDRYQPIRDTNLRNFHETFSNFVEIYFFHSSSVGRIVLAFKFSSKFLSFLSRVAIQFPLRFEINDRRDDYSSRGGVSRSFGLENSSGSSPVIVFARPNY